MNDDATTSQKLTGIWHNDTYVISEASREGAWIESDRAQNPETMDWYHNAPEIEEKPTNTCCNPRCTNETETAYCSAQCGVAHSEQVAEEYEP